MPQNEKGQPEGRPIPNCVYHDAEESKSSNDFAQALTRSVFGRSFTVVHAHIGDDGKQRHYPSRIRAWRAPR